MSRIGKQPVQIPEKTEVSVSDDVIVVKGPLGELSRPNNSEIKVEVVDGQVIVSPKSDSIFSRALWGTYASHISNMVQGVNKPYEKKLIVEGVGFKSNVNGNTLVMSLGFSHPVEMAIPEGLTVTAEKNVITVSGINKETVGQFSSKVKSKKKPEPYKGKCIV
ncbi:50S ribosomal protein L6, partial [Patescibacteria group bacterium]